ncbi:hypothetical protein [Specibacter cremeus]|uniref:hypothetical protein n=1 Tax=Specibacter cremeus TaxID=1629051 RepID=UPI000F7AC476|nr:hypothetical protein [Specibacter cremeus]
MSAAPDASAEVVTATALGPWPGIDMPEAVMVALGELGDPHLPLLPELPDRGVGTDAVGRTAALLVELPVDVQPFGWRLVERPGADHRRAVSMLASDVNVLADVAGTRESVPPAVKIQVLGPLTLAASVYLHYGERALLDHGARRDVAESLAAGLAGHVAMVAQAVPGAAITVQLDETDIARVLDGAIPTASGYRTLRSVPKDEVRGAWQLLVRAAHDAGATDVVLNLGTGSLPGSGREDSSGWRTGLELAVAGDAEAVAVPLARLDPRHWEVLAGALESGTRLWAGVVPATAALPQVSALVERVMRPWNGIGLPAGSLAGLRLTPEAGLAGLSPAAARAVLARTTDTARALNDVRTGD